MSWEMAGVRARVAALRTMHVLAAEEIDWDRIINDPGPDPPIFRPSLLDRALQRDASSSWRHKRRVRRYLDAYDPWQDQRDLACGVLRGDTDAYKMVLADESVFGAIRGVGADVTILQILPSAIEVEICTEAHQTVPTHEITIRQSGMRSKTPIPGIERTSIVLDCLCSVALRAARDVFAVLPVGSVLVHVAEDVIDTSTGHDTVATYVSALIERDELRKLRMGRIDPADAMANFQHALAEPAEDGVLTIERLSLPTGSPVTPDSSSPRPTSSDPRTADAGLERRDGAEPDMGTSLLRHVADRLGVQETTARADELAFTVWSDGLTQRVGAKSSTSKGRESAGRIHASVRVVTGITDVDGCLQVLAELNRSASFSSWILDERSGSLDHRCALRLDTVRPDVAERLLPVAVALQASDARAAADVLASSLGGQVATLDPPADADQVGVTGVAAIRRDVMAFDRNDAGQLFEDVLERLGTIDDPPWTEVRVRSGRLRGRLAQDGRRARDDTPSAAHATLELTTDEQHPIYGPGLAARVWLDAAYADEVKLANDLNQPVTDDTSTSSLLGSWCTEDRLSHRLFVPGIAFDGLPQQEVLQMVRDVVELCCSQHVAAEELLRDADVLPLDDTPGPLDRVWPNPDEELPPAVPFDGP